MNLYGLPEFVAYSLLVGMACVLLQKDKSAPLRFWLLGWVIVLIHSGIFMLLPFRFPYDVLGRGTLIVGGQSFLLASYYHSGRTSRDTRLQLCFIAWCVLSVAFQLNATAAADRQPDGFGDATLYGLTAACAVAAVLTSIEFGQGRGTLTVLAVCTYLIQGGLLATYGALMSSQWQMGLTYFAVAYFFVVRVRARLTMGAAFTAASFVLWGLVFPVYALIMVYAPSIGQQIEAGVWNLPKFLAAASMILMLLEERIARITYLATHDQLTGLPNRRLCDQRFDEAVSARSGFGLLVIDLNRFKAVNDTMGHQAGDELLRTLAERFTTALRRSDIIARTGGDEFTAILGGTRTIQDAETISTKLMDALAEPILLRGQPYRASASVGAAVYPHDGLSLAELSAAADQRMYHYKLKMTDGHHFP